MEAQGFSKDPRYFSATERGHVEHDQKQQQQQEEQEQEQHQHHSIWGYVGVQPAKYEIDAPKEKTWDGLQKMFLDLVVCVMHLLPV